MLINIDEVVKKEKEKKKHHLECNNRNYNTNTNDGYEYAKELVPLLSPARADNYADWIRVGWCLRNIDHRLLPEWIEFSKKSPKFSIGECERKWDFMKSDGNGLKMGTLVKWAKDDSPQRFAEMVQTNVINLILTARSETEFDVAKVVESMYQHLYVYSPENKKWYAFQNHRWVLDEGGLILKKLLPTEVADEFRKARTHYSNMALNAIHQEDKEKHDKY